MGKLLVTGASGDIGRKTLVHLLEKRPAGELVGLVRDPAKAADLSKLGIELRQGDYMDTDSLLRAFSGVDKIMLTSTHAFTDRNGAHGNVIDSAVKAGAKHLVFMPIARKSGSTFAMKEITEEDIFTVNKLRSSGLVYTLAKHPPFLDAVKLYAGLNAVETGVRIVAGDGKFTAVSRDDLAAAHAAILTGTGHVNKTYTLTGYPPVSYREIASILSEISGKDVPYIVISDEEYVKSKVADGFPDFIAEFVLKWIHGMNAGEWDTQTNDFERLVGRKPKSPADFFRENLA